MRLGDVALGLEDGHVVAHGGAGHAEVVPLDERLASRSAPWWRRSRRRWRAAPRTDDRRHYPSVHLPLASILRLPAARTPTDAPCSCVSAPGGSAPVATSLVHGEAVATRDKSKDFCAGDLQGRSRRQALSRSRVDVSAVGTDTATADPSRRAGDHHDGARSSTGCCPRTPRSTATCSRTPCDGRASSISRTDCIGRCGPRCATGRCCMPGCSTWTPRSTTRCRPDAATTRSSDLAVLRRFGLPDRRWKGRRHRPWAVTAFANCVEGTPKPARSKVDTN